MTISIKNPKLHLSNGVVTVVATKGSAKVAVFTLDSVALVAHITRGKAYVSPSYSDDAQNAAIAFIQDVLPPYYGIKTAPIVKAFAPTGADLECASIILPHSVDDYARTPDAQLHDALVTAGYDISSLVSGLTTSISSLDYSALRETSEGREAFELYDKQLASMGISYATSPLPQDLELLKNSIQSGRTKNVLFYGAAGTGKSILAARLSNAMGAPMLTYCFQEGTTSDDILGSYAPAAGGGFEFKVAPLLKAFSEGWQIRLDELNFASQNILSILNQFLDDTPTIPVNGTTYNRHPNFVVYGTFNPGYEGTYPLNPALKSRFSKVFIPELNAEEFCSRMIAGDKTRYGISLSPDYYKKLFEITQSIAAQASKMHEVVDVCLRNAQQLSAMILLKPLSEAEFKHAFDVAYTFNLALDNKASMSAMEKLSVEESYKNNISALYKLYDFKIIPVASVASFPKLEDLLETEFNTDVNDASSNATNISDLSDEDEKAMSDLIDGMYNF